VPTSATGDKHTPGPLHARTTTPGLLNTTPAEHLIAAARDAVGNPASPHPAQGPTTCQPAQISPIRSVRNLPSHSRPLRQNGGSVRSYFDIEHAGDGPAVARRPPSSPADHAAPARFLVSTVGALAGRPTLRGWRLDSAGREHLSFLLGFRSLRGHPGDCGYPTTRTHSCAQGRTACLKARQTAYSGHGGERAAAPAARAREARKV
jgi:hypothetical protein